MIQWEPREEPPDDFILQLRLAALRKNLEQVRGTRASVFDRLHEIADLAGQISEKGVPLTVRNLRRRVTRLHEDFRDLHAALGAFAEESAEEFEGNLRRAVVQATAIEQTIDSAAVTVARIQARSGEITAGGATLSDLGDRMDSIFSLQSRDLIKQVDQLGAAPPEGGGFHMETDKEAIDAAWATYRSMLRPKCEELFSEYVDFLGGFALRNTGFDNSICRMADDLIERWHTIGEETFWHSMAIPARRETSARTLARMIRLGFPEWTIWAVPLSAYEFGRVVLRSSPPGPLAQYVAQFSQQPGCHDAEVCLSDAFATYAMGPAYAYASVLLRFEPEPNAGSEEDADGRRLCADNRRAFVVFTMLGLMDEGRRLFGITQQLKRLWKKALEQAGATSELGEAEVQLKDWATYVWDFLKDNALPSLRYDAKRWQGVTGWGNGDLRELEKQPDFNLSTRGDIRDVLNLAWWQRMRDPTVSEDELAAAAVRLWQTTTPSPRDTASKAKVG
jgi:hypothetical protein